MSLGFSIYNAMTSANSDSFISFLSWMPFISSSCLTALVRTSSTKLNKSGWGDILALFLTIEEEIQLFTTDYNASCVFTLIYGLYYVEVCSLSTCNVDSFCHKWMLNFVKCFFCIYWENLINFIFISLMWNDWSLSSYWLISRCWTTLVILDSTW